MKPGEIVIFTTEEYSDFGIAGVFVATETFSLDEKLEQFLSLNEKYSAQAFMAWLVNLDFVHEQAVLEAHLGSYGERPSRPLERT